MKIKTDYNLCESHGMCEAMAPKYFEIDDDDYQQVKQEQVDPADLATVQQAVAACPRAALSLVEDDA